MLGFLRKIRRSLIEEGHLRKYLVYAIGEILLVMIGILLALQINNWSENTKDRAEEREILEALRQELQENRASITEITHNVENRILDFLNWQALTPIEIETAPPDSLHNLLFVAVMRFYTTELSTGTLSSVINSGKYDLIRNRTIRSLLADYLAAIEGDIPELGKVISETSIDALNVLTKYEGFDRVQSSTGPVSAEENLVTAQTLKRVRVDSSLNSLIVVKALHWRIYMYELGLVSRQIERIEELINEELEAG